jgi:histidinol-phosphate aminotransferase
MISWQRLLSGSVREVGAYLPGVSATEIKARYGLGEVVRLNWNENLEGPLPGVIEESARELELSWAYPEEAYDRFRDAVAAWVGAERSEVIPGHGIQALTLALVNAFVEPGDAVVVPRPTYGLYAQACAAAGAAVHRVENGESLALDLESIALLAREHGAKLAWICDPNNPTGLRIRDDEWRTFLDSIPGGCVAVVDEAYVDYVEPSARLDRLREIRAGHPVVVLRTFSKIFGLAGLRLGYALVHESLSPFISTVQEPFNVNCAALAAGLASLRRTELLPERRESARAARQSLARPLERAGIRCLPSDANFVLVELGADDLEVAELLAREGLLVRPGSEFGLPGYVRVTLGEPRLMKTVAQHVIEAVGAVV